MNVSNLPRGKHQTHSRSTPRPAARAPLAPIEEPLPPHFSRVQAVADRVRAWVLREGLQPGARLGTKDELAQHYGVSLGTLNGAIRVLESQRITESRPGVSGGVFVARSGSQLELASVLLSTRDHGDVEVLSDVYLARVQLDVLLARLAAEFRTDDDILALQLSLTSMANQHGDLQGGLRSTWDLHGQIAQAAHAPVLFSLYQMLIERLGAQIAGVSSRGEHGVDPALAVAHAQRHSLLVQAIVDGDKERATLLAEEHGQRLRATLLAGLKVQKAGQRRVRRR